eukprot:scaffold45584_cov39-Attheya_sp.AAC.5
MMMNESSCVVCVGRRPCMPHAILLAGRIIFSRRYSPFIGGPYVLAGDLDPPRQNTRFKSWETSRV